MSALTEQPMTTTTTTTLDPASVNVRVKIAALWTAMMFVFAYVDLFSLYRADVRADLEAGHMSVFSMVRASCWASRPTSPSPASWCSSALPYRAKP